MTASTAANARTATPVTTPRRREEELDRSTQAPSAGPGSRFWYVFDRWLPVSSPPQDDDFVLA